MMISHKNKFIFIKTTKTAGSSIELALSAYCGLNDIILPLRAEEEEYRKNLYGKEPINYKYSLTELPKAFIKSVLKNKKKYKKYLKNPWLNSFPFKNIKYKGHIRALRIKKMFSSEVWNSYYKFSVERNPWDKAVSRYYWDLAYGGRVQGRSINEHIEFLAEKKPHRLSNWQIYANGNEILVDKVILYENLRDELMEVGKKIGISNLELPSYKAKSFSRPDHKPVAELLSENSIKIISEVCYKEINHFGYQPPLKY